MSEGSISNQGPGSKSMPSAKRKRWIWAWVVLAALGGVALTWGVGIIDPLGNTRAIEKAERWIESGRASEAESLLRGLWTFGPSRDRARWLLGQSLMGQGKRREAREVWRGVPESSQWWPRVGAELAEIELQAGRLATAEALLEKVLDSGQPPPSAIPRLELVYKLQARLDDARALHEDPVVWRRVDPRLTLRALWSLEHDPFQLLSVRRYLESGLRDHPGDDRIWLGLANVFLLEGRLEESLSWLVRCREQRSDDPAVWRVTLAYALAADRWDVLWSSVDHLKTSTPGVSPWIGLRAVLASRLRRTDEELAAIERLHELGRAGPEQLAEWVLELRKAGREQQARRVEQDRLLRIDAQREYQRRFREWLESTPTATPLTSDSATSMAELAKQLGREVESACWRILAGMRPDRVPFAEELSLPLRDVLDDLRATTPIRGLATTTASPLETVEFEDQAEALGLVFQFDNGASDRRQLPETMSGGVALLDLDGDHHLDVYVVQGGPFPPPAAAPGPDQGSSDRLFRNLGNGRFEDVSQRAGLRADWGYGHGVAVGDYDNDGDPDLFLTRWRRYVLLRNRGDGSFEDVTAGCNLTGERDWPTSAAFADLDRDGDLDLYVCHYLRWSAESPKVCGESGRVNYCHPLDFPAQPDHLFRNDGGRFTEISREAGIIDTDGRGLGVVVVDLNEDGLLDLFVANDQSANLLFWNRGRMRFEEDAVSAGVATAGDGSHRAGMGVACGDVDGDGRADLAVTNFFGEATTLYHNEGQGRFSDWTLRSNLGTLTRSKLGFGIALLDADEDGKLDLAQVNGHVNNGEPYFPFAMPSQLLIGDGEGRFRSGSCNQRPPWSMPRLGRGLAVGDLDGDGRPDLAVLSQDRPLAALINRGAPQRHRIVLSLRGGASGRDAVGVRATLSQGDRRAVSWRLGGGSYQSASHSDLHFGLGERVERARLEVLWPSGRVDQLEGLDPDTHYLITEGADLPTRIRRLGEAAVER